MQVSIEKITIGKDGRLYVTVKHPWFANKPTLLIETGQWEKNLLAALNAEIQGTREIKLGEKVIL